MPISPDGKHKSDIILPKDQMEQYERLSQMMAEIRMNHLLALHNIDTLAKDITAFLDREERSPAVQAMLEQQAQFMLATYTQEMARWAAQQAEDRLKQGTQPIRQTPDIVDVSYQPQPSYKPDGSPAMVISIMVIVVGAFIWAAADLVTFFICGVPLAILLLFIVWKNLGKS